MPSESIVGGEMPEPNPDTLAQRLLATVPDMVYIADADGRLAWWNDRVPEVTGYSDEELAGKPVFEMLAPDDRDGARTSYERVGTFPPTETREFDVLTKDGDRIPHEFNGSLLEVDDEPMVVGIARDVSTRREREAAIRRQRDELETLNRISQTVHDVLKAVVDAASRCEVEEVVCERLAASELYRAVWVGRNNPGGTVEPVAAVGPSDDFIELVEWANELPWDRPAKVAVETGEIQVVRGMPDVDLPDAICAEIDRLGIESGTAVPIVNRGAVIGVLAVYSSRPEAFSEREQAAFGRLGEVIGFAINAVQTERLLLSDTVTELTFRISGERAFLASVSAVADGSCRHEWSTPVGSGSDHYRHYITVSGIDPERVAAIGAEKPTIERIEYVGENGDAHVFEVVTSDSLVRRFFDSGAVPVSMVARDGETTVVAELPAGADTRPVVEAAKDLYDVELVSKREVERPVRTTDEFRDAVAARITDRQQAALRHAFFEGYFSWPRDATAEEIADSMDISSPTFHYHIRRGQRALVEAYLQHLDD